MTATPRSDFYQDAELLAVNEVLGSIGQSPVTTIEFNNPEVFLVYQLLQQALTDTLSEGWSFNKDKGFTLIPQDDGTILVPNEVLSIDGSGEDINRTTKIINRGGLLYDKVSQSYTFTDSVKVDITWSLPLEEVPIPVRRYVTARAAGRAASELVNNTELYKLLSQTEGTLRASLMEYECNTGDYTFFGSPEGTVYRSFQPYRALSR